MWLTPFGPLKDTMDSTVDEQHESLLPSYDEAQSPASESKLWRSAKSCSLFLSNNPILLYTFCIQFLNYLAKHVIEVPTIKLIEQALCNRYWASQGQTPPSSGWEIAERFCKTPEIQKELAAITGLKFTFDALPALLTALFYGSIADRFGRRIVLALFCVGTLSSYLWILFVCYANLNLPVRLVWVSSIFLCIGGSQRVAKSMNFTVVADSTDKAHRYECTLFDE